MLLYLCIYVYTRAFQFSFRFFLHAKQFHFTFSLRPWEKQRENFQSECSCKFHSEFSKKVQQRIRICNMRLTEQLSTEKYAIENGSIHVKAYLTRICTPVEQLTITLASIFLYSQSWNLIYKMHINAKPWVRQNSGTRRKC